MIRTAILSVPFRHRIMLAVVLTLFGAMTAMAAEIDRFAGRYTGSAEIVDADGTSSLRDLSVEISPADKGFSVQWTTTTYRPDGRSKEKTYDISFVPSDRDGVFAAAMKKNVFGHEVQLDPMKGEPYVWARIMGETLTVYSLFVDQDGGYELQQFDRTLANGGLTLDFVRIGNGMKKRTTSTFLQRHD